MLSPSTVARDRNVKADLYLASGVREVWLVDPESTSVEIRTPSASRTIEAGKLAQSEAVDGFRLDLGRLF